MGYDMSVLKVDRVNLKEDWDWAQLKVEGFREDMMTSMIMREQYKKNVSKFEAWFLDQVEGDFFLGEDFRGL